MQNTCESACQEAAEYVANIQCRPKKGVEKYACLNYFGVNEFNKCMRDNKNTNCDCKGSCQISANYRCMYDKNHIKNFKNNSDCVDYSKLNCNDKMNCNTTNKGVLKSMNTTEEDAEEDAEGDSEGDVEGDSEGDEYGDSEEDAEGDVTNCTCPCCMKGGCGRRGYSSIWYTLFIILIVLLFISMFASLVYNGKKS